jgi:hypothetical protein
MFAVRHSLAREELGSNIPILEAAGTTVAWGCAIMSALPPEATKLMRCREVTRCANRVVMRRSKKDRYSITSSAQASSTHLMRISTR